MNKIMTGTLGVLATGVVVTTAAYAAFTSQATISGINFSTGSSLLEVSATNVSETFVSNLNAGLNITNVFPGFGMDNTEMTSFFVRNNASVGSPDMEVTAQLTSAGGWGSGLENYVELAVVPADTDPATVDDVEYMTLSEWNAAPMTIINALAAGTPVELDAYVRLLDTAPDSVSGQALTNITFTLNGTPVTVEAP